jgi:hypothetical protein
MPQIQPDNPILLNMDPRLVREHSTRLDARHFQRFSEEEIATHVGGLARLGPDGSRDLLFENPLDFLVDCGV